MGLFCSKLNLTPSFSLLCFPLHLNPNLGSNPCYISPNKNQKTKRSLKVIFTSSDLSFSFSFAATFLLFSYPYFDAYERQRWFVRKKKLSGSCLAFVYWHDLPHDLRWLAAHLLCWWVTWSRQIYIRSWFALSLKD